MKIRFKHVGIVLIFTGVIVLILIKCGVLLRKYPTMEETKKMFLDNRESFEIANTFLLNVTPNEDGIVNYNLDLVEVNKSQMTEQEYEALKVVFSNNMIVDYHRRVADEYSYGINGKFMLKSNYKDVTMSICYIPETQQKLYCTQIIDNWYIYEYYHS